MTYQAIAVLTSGTNRSYVDPVIVCGRVGKKEASVIWKAVTNAYSAANVSATVYLIQWSKSNHWSVISGAETETTFGWTVDRQLENHRQLVEFLSK